MKSIRTYFANLFSAWDQFWFTPADPALLSAIRIATGLLLLWTHLVWSVDLMAFFGGEGWIETSLRTAMDQGRMTWSLFDLLGPAWLKWTYHGMNLVAFAMLTLGWFSRTAAVWSFIAAVSYASYVTPGAFFGLDKINCLLTMYLMLGPSGACYSLDRRIRNRRGTPPPGQSVMANFAIRLLQLHLCVVYLFSGIGKLDGEMWRNGQAIWFAVANVEYRSLDMTWMAGWLWLAELLAHVTVFWELFYGFIVWNRLARPWVLLTAVGVHGFIGLGMGMPEFATAMLVANASFLAPGTIRAWFDPLARRLGLG